MTNEEKYNQFEQINSQALLGGGMEKIEKQHAAGKLTARERINKLFEELVPFEGKADSLAGELVRAMSRIGYRFYNDGDQLGIGYGKETCNPAGRFLGAKGNDKIAKLTADAWAVYSEEAYEKVLDILCGAVADYVEQNPDLRNQPTEDMWDFKDEEEDQDDSWDEEEDDWGEEEDYEDEEDY